MSLKNDFYRVKALFLKRPLYLLQASCRSSAAATFHLRDTRNTLGVVNRLVCYPDQGHGWTGRYLQDSFMKIAGSPGERALTEHRFKTS
ncbi:MAG TPA: hypothetical protein VFX43_04135 [Chitinophagaceae bacterium]|nr:hypothetical protein [Chitinophagaceae bacterium]